MNKQEVTINKVIVTINTVRVDGKRMAKLIYAQIPCGKDYFHHPADVVKFAKSKHVLGHCAPENGYTPILYVMCGQLYKSWIANTVDPSADHAYSQEYRDALILMRESLPYLYIGA